MSYKNFEQKVKKFSYSILALAFIAGVLFMIINREKSEPVVVVAREEINITIIPGWNLEQIAENWVEIGLVSSTKDVFDILGSPVYSGGEEGKKIKFKNNEFKLLEERLKNVSYEGFLMPDTYRVYQDADLKEEVLVKVFNNLEGKITVEMREEIKKQGRSFYEILTMASMVEREAKVEEDMKMVADIFWRRLDMNWALQSCATVNYITGKNDPGVTNADREIDSSYNTYKYPGLPSGPIGNPGLNAIKATIYPTENDNWYFMSGRDGEMHYGRTLDEHNSNVYNYLR